MKIIYLYGLMILSLLFIFTGCGKKADKITVKEGKYISADGESYITVDNYIKGKSDKFEEVIGYCDIQFHNVDMSSFEEFYLASNTANYVTVNYNGDATEEQIQEIEDMLMERVDFENQFEENKANYFFFKDDKGAYGLGCEVDGSGFDQGYETYMSLVYKPAEKIIEVDGVKYILEE